MATTETSKRSALATDDLPGRTASGTLTENGSWAQLAMIVNGLAVIVQQRQRAEQEAAARARQEAEAAAVAAETAEETEKSDPEPDAGG